jgi:predicted O-methyltransferase YrrM
MWFSELRDYINDVARYEPTYVPTDSAWHGHGRFAVWLVEKLAPRVIVELGTHSGYSYFSMCQAVDQNNIDTRCYAVDTWQGDEHAGFYDDSVYDGVIAKNIQYQSFSTLLRKRFDEALEDFPDGAIDLLHIDGRHFYDDVKEDFESYIPKLSPKAIVLFHDVTVEERGFGVKQYFAELMKTYDGFHFVHSHGLGVLFFGVERSVFTNNLAMFTSDDMQLGYIRAVFETPVPHNVNWDDYKRLTKFGKRFAKLKQSFRKLPRKIKNLFS